jgi:hypothetical protein
MSGSSLIVIGNALRLGLRIEKTKTETVPAMNSGKLVPAE